MALATNRALGVVLHACVQKMLAHLGKADAHGESVNSRKLRLILERGVTIPPQPSVPFLDYADKVILLSYKMQKAFTDKELCNLAGNSMLLAILLSSVSASRAMLQLTSP